MAFHISTDVAFAECHNLYGFCSNVICPNYHHILIHLLSFESKNSYTLIDLSTSNIEQLLPKVPRIIDKHPNIGLNIIYYGQGSTNKR